MIAAMLTLVVMTLLMVRAVPLRVGAWVATLRTCRCSDNAMTSRHGTVSPAAKGDTGRVNAHWQVSRGKSLPPRPGTPVVALMFAAEIGWLLVDPTPRGK
jgi:hypothetical protein